MGAESAIEWCTHTFSPWLGCTPVSAACDHCYAAAMARRYGWPEYRAGVPRRLTAPSTWKLPRRWQRRAAANGVRASVFPSLCDPFDGEVTDTWRDDFVAEIAATPDLDWLLLTKRPHLAAKYWAQRPMPANIGLGVTAENQAMADLRIPQLLAIAGPKFRFVSIEPMLGPIDLRRALYVGPEGGWEHAGATRQMLHWVIAGGESGPKARPSHPDWFRALRDQCAEADVPFFFKQWGEWTPGENVDRERGTVPTATWFDDSWSIGREDLAWSEGHVDDQPDLYRVGKKAAGALLDGRHWRQFPPQLQSVAVPA